MHTDALLSYLRETVTELKPLFADPSGRDQLRGRMVPMLKRIAILSKAVITCVHHKVEGAPDGVTNTKVGCVACSGCSSALDQTEGHIHYDGRCFHVACMRCASCQATVTAQRFALDNDGRPLCESCAPLALGLPFCLLAGPLRR